MEFDSNEVGRRIAKRRNELGLKQTQAAEILEISNNHLSGIERGRTLSSLPLFVKICNILQVTPDYLLEGTMHSNNVPLNIMENLRLCDEEDVELVEQFVRMLLNRKSRPKDDVTIWKKE